MMASAVSGGPWSEAHKLGFSAAIADLIASRAGDDIKPTARAQQTCKHFERYLTSTEVSTLRDADVLLDIRVEVIANRASKLGLCCPSEDTLGRMCAVISCL